MKKALSLVLAIVLMFGCVTVSFAADEQIAKPFENSEFFTDGDYTLHYRTYEPEESAKNQIMLLHGFCLSTVSFEGLAEEYVANGYKVVLVDLPDFGYSSRETSKMELVAREELVYDLMTALGGTWIVGGHSMGGGVAANLATNYPETVTGLVLIAPQTAFEVSGVMALLMRSSLAQAGYELILGFASRCPAIIRILLNMSFGDLEFAMAYDTNRIADPLQIKGTGAGLAIMASHATPTDIEKFGELTIPIIIVTASNDNIAEQGRIDDLVNSGAPNLTTKNFEYGGHMVMEYDPQAVADVTLGTIEMCA